MYLAINDNGHTLIAGIDRGNIDVHEDPISLFHSSWPIQFAKCHGDILALVGCEDHTLPIQFVTFLNGIRHLEEAGDPLNEETLRYYFVNHMENTLSQLGLKEKDEKDSSLETTPFVAVATPSRLYQVGCWQRVTQIPLIFREDPDIYLALRAAFAQEGDAKSKVLRFFLDIVGDDKKSLAGSFYFFYWVGENVLEAHIPWQEGDIELNVEDLLCR